MKPSTKSESSEQNLPQKIRLQKFLSEIGFSSRREAENLIRDKKIRIDGIVAQLGDRIFGDEKIEIDGKILKVKKPKKVFIAFHKPAGVESTCAKIPGIPTLADLDFRIFEDGIRFASKNSNFVGEKLRLFPVGRLDRASRGLLILTNDGETANRLAHPKFDHEKEYFVRVDRPISDRILAKFAAGVQTLKFRTSPAICERVAPDEFKITLREGKNRQIRKMCVAENYTARDIFRTRIGKLRLGDLGAGEFRILNSADLEKLKTKS